MYRKSPIITVLDPAIVGSGLQEDLHLGQKLLWAVADNVTFYQGKVQRRLPKSLFIDLGVDFPIRGLSQKQVSDGTRFSWGAAINPVTGLVFPFKWDGITQTSMTAQVGQLHQTSNGPATYVDFTHYGDWTIINSSSGAAKIEKNDGNIVVLADAPVDVVQFAKKLNFLIAVGHGVTGNKVSWSAADAIEDWTETQANEAGELSIEDFDTRITACSRLGQNISVYAEDQMALVTFINAPFYFGQRVMLDGIGAVGKCSVCSDGASNYGIGRNGVWWTDGVTYRYIDEGRMRDYFQHNINWDQASKIIALRNDLTNCIEFFMPTGVSLDISEGWSFDPRNQAWSKLPPVSFKIERKIFPHALEGDENGCVFYSQSDATEAGPLALKTKPIPAQLQTQHGLTDVHNDCEISEIDLLLKEVSNVEMRYGTSTEIDAAPTFSDWIALTAGARTIRNQAGVPSGVYTTLEFRSTADNWSFNLQGLLVFGVVEGTKRDGQA